MTISTSAERHEEQVQYGLDVYRDTFIRLFVQEAAGGRVPGLPKLSEAELLQVFDETPPEVWQQIAINDPAQAAKLLVQYRKLEEVAGGRI